MSGREINDYAARVSSTPDPIVRLGHGLKYSIIIERGKGRNAEFIAGVHFGRPQTRRELRQWRDAIQRGIEPNATERRPEGYAASGCSVSGSEGGKA